MATDLTGQRFSRLLAVEKVGSEKLGAIWKFKCDCGCEYIGLATHVKRGRAKSCGCLRRESAAQQGRQMLKHGLIKSPEYSAFHAMHSRCYNDKNASYARYGGRGITVCERWQSLDSFLDDMGKKPCAGMSLERINVHGNYEPLNCKWATAKEQANNRTNSPRNKNV